MAIDFPKVEAWNGNRDIVSFPADSDGKRISCAISWEALQDNYGGANQEPLACFKANRAAIEGKATGLILRKRFEADGSILVRSGDGP